MGDCTHKYTQEQEEIIKYIENSTVFVAQCAKSEPNPDSALEIQNTPVGPILNVWLSYVHQCFPKHPKAVCVLRSESCECKQMAGR